MNKSQERYLREYIKRCQAALKMTDWVLDVEDSDDDGEVASIYLTEGQQHGRIGFSQRFWKEPASDKRNTVGHELAHGKTRDLMAVIRRQLVELLGTGLVFRVIYKNVKDQEELLVDSLASVFEAVLPPWEGP